MKKEINNENKAKFFALYYDQDVMFEIAKVKSYDLYITQKGIDLLVYGESGYLTLKSLSKISDEDAIDVAKILVKEFNNEPFSHIETNCNCGVYFKNGYINIYPDFSFLVNLYNGQSVYNGPQSILFAEHYLRSKGYALDWMWLSVDEMVQAEWIKLLGT